MRAIWRELSRHVNVAVTAAAVVLLLQASLSAFDIPVAAVPEIDGGSLAAGLGLLGAGVLWLRARRRVK
jgi:MYXO-CTERM domain-containing protein